MFGHLADKGSDIKVKLHYVIWLVRVHLGFTDTFLGVAGGPGDTGMSTVSDPSPIAPGTALLLCFLLIMQSTALLCHTLLP